MIMMKPFQLVAILVALTTLPFAQGTDEPDGFDLDLCVEETLAWNTCAESNCAECLKLTEVTDDDTLGDDTTGDDNLTCDDISADAAAGVCEGTKCCPSCASEFSALAKCGGEAALAFIALFGGPTCENIDYGDCFTSSVGGSMSSFAALLGTISAIAVFLF